MKELGFRRTDILRAWGRLRPLITAKLVPSVKHLYRLAVKLGARMLETALLSI